MGGGGRLGENILEKLCEGEKAQSCKTQIEIPVVAQETGCVALMSDIHLPFLSFSLKYFFFLILLCI